MNKTSEYRFTIIVPIYNEEDNIARLESTFAEYLPKCIEKACVLFVNDGSKDSSLKGIEEICSRNKDFYYISFDRNRGLSAAIKAGFDTCESPLVGYMDADLQTAPEDFNLLLPHAADYTLVSGIRARRNDSGSKRIQSKIANGFRRMMTGDTATDTGCPLKVMQTPYAKRIPMFKGMHRFFAALITLQDGGTFFETPVRHFPRTAGQSKFHLWNRLIGPFQDCFAFRWMRSRYINYHIAKDNI
ncbi:MAG: glycosyltransferase [Bacteroidales bacterium]|nr:glycosyltransferase [Bacteroidales bacterium]